MTLRDYLLWSTPSNLNLFKRLLAMRFKLFAVSLAVLVALAPSSAFAYDLLNPDGTPFTNGSACIRYSSTAVTDNNNQTVINGSSSNVPNGTFRGYPTYTNACAGPSYNFVLGPYSDGTTFVARNVSTIDGSFSNVRSFEAIGGVWCENSSCSLPPVLGCTDPSALNYDPDATEDDGSCEYPAGPENPLIDYLAPALDNATYVDLFTWTLLLIPLLFVVPIVFYWLILKPLAIIKQLL